MILGFNERCTPRVQLSTINGSLIYKGQHGGGGEAVILSFKKNLTIDSGMLSRQVQALIPMHGCNMIVEHKSILATLHVLTIIKKSQHEVCNTRVIILI